MKLKFPTTQRLLPPLELSDDERDEFVALATQLVDNTLAEYSEYNRHHQIRYRSQWKPVKKRENLTVFKETQSHGRRKRQQSIRAAANGGGEHSSSSSASASPPAPENEWTMPKLLLAGTIVGTLDDVMYGLAAFDVPSMLVNSTYVHGEVVDVEVLHEVLGPTPEEPFRFLGIKWIVKDNSAVISPFTSPRDLVVLESIGVRTLPSGERVGYHLMHSLDIEGYGPLPIKSVLRDRVSSCALYRQLPNSSVDAYIPANFELNGHPGKRAAVASAASGLIFSWRAVLCAQSKKLAWLLTIARVKPVVWDVTTTTSSSTKYVPQAHPVPVVRRPNVFAMPRREKDQLLQREEKDPTACHSALHDVCHQDKPDERVHDRARASARWQVDEGRGSRQ
uniref:START domain-containing protein n=1 Tax=Globisporangium ultimum (strain ATCC 200006 / CBS 805.95 / DAOM BR144) TaxID=431595 RepID=K3WVS9_GLOUD